MPFIQILKANKNDFFGNKYASMTDVVNKWILTNPDYKILDIKIQESKDEQLYAVISFSTEFCKDNIPDLAKEMIPTYKCNNSGKDILSCPNCGNKADPKGNDGYNSFICPVCGQIFTSEVREENSGSIINRDRL